MPTYDYHCEENSRTISVQHSMKEKISSWGELCQRAGVEPGKTATSASVERIISGGIALPIASADAAIITDAALRGVPRSHRPRAGRVFEDTAMSKTPRPRHPHQNQNCRRRRQ
jgi:hypothetical protein